MLTQRMQDKCWRSSCDKEECWQPTQQKRDTVSCFDESCRQVLALRAQHVHVALRRVMHVHKDVARKENLLCLNHVRNGMLTFLGHIPQTNVFAWLVQLHVGTMHVTKNCSTSIRHVGTLRATKHSCWRSSCDKEYVQELIEFVRVCVSASSVYCSSDTWAQSSSVCSALFGFFTGRLLEQKGSCFVPCCNNKKKEDNVGTHASECWRSSCSKEHVQALHDLMGFSLPIG